MDEFTPTPFKIDTEELFNKFLEENKHKIPEDVKVEKVSNNCDDDDHEGVVIPAYALSLGLYLPFDPLIREILSRLHLAPIRLGPNCWRIMFGILALNRICKINLGWNEFCYCYVAKQNSGATLCYFSPRDKKLSLVTNLPSSERGAWKDELVYLRGNWERRPGDTGAVQYLVPRTKATGKPRGVKPQEGEVNEVHLKKALSLKNRDRDWRYLLDPHNWGTIEEAVTLKKQSRCKQLMEVDQDAAHYGGLNHSPSVNNHGVQEEDSTEDVHRIPGRFRQESNWCCPQASAAAALCVQRTPAGVLFHSSDQNLPNSHAYAPMPIAPNLPPNPSHDDNQLDNNNHCEDGTGMNLNVNYSSFTEKGIDYQQGSEQHLFESDPMPIAPMSIAPNLPPNPSHDDNQLDNNNPREDGTGMDLNVNYSSFTEKGIDYQQGSEQHLSESDPFLKDIQLLERKPCEEVCLEATQSAQRVGILIKSLVNRIECQNTTMKELQATNERLNKEVEELKLEVGEEAVRTEITPKAIENENSLLKLIEKAFQEIESLKKDNAKRKKDNAKMKKDNAKMKAKLMEVKEMISRQQNEPDNSEFGSINTSFHEFLVDTFTNHYDDPGNQNYIREDGIELTLASRVDIDTNRPGDDDLQLGMSSGGSTHSGHYKRTKR